jgi:hypothetical protein
MLVSRWAVVVGENMKSPHKNVSTAIIALVCNTTQN